MEEIKKRHEHAKVVKNKVDNHMNPFHVMALIFVFFSMFELTQEEPKIILEWNHESFAMPFSQ